jgi:hypothetical protein
MGTRWEAGGSSRARSSEPGLSDSSGAAAHRRRVVSLVALLLGLTIGWVPAGVARADVPTRESYSNLNMRCIGFTDDGQEVDLYVIRSSEQPGTVAELFLTSADRQDQQMWTSTDAVIADGVVSADIPLSGTDSAVVAGTYRAVADAVTLRPRFRIENSVVVRTLVQQPFAVELSTSDLGSIGPVDLACDVESLTQSSHWSNPHRIVVRAQQPAVELDESCAAGAVTSVQLQAAEGEYILLARTADAFGYGLVTPSGGVGEIEWFDTAEESISVQPVQLSLQRSGAPLVSTTADGTTTSVVHATPQDVRLSFGLPDGERYDRTCSGYSITQNYSTADTGR